MAVNWVAEKCKQTGKNKVLIVTTASKSKTNDFENEMEEWRPSFSNSLSLTLFSLHARTGEGTTKGETNAKLGIEQCEIWNRQGA